MTELPPVPIESGLVDDLTTDDVIICPASSSRERVTSVLRYPDGYVEVRTASLVSAEFTPGGGLHSHLHTYHDGDHLRMARRTVPNLSESDRPGRQEDQDV